jgi:cytochrome c oxidase subunit II
VVEAMTEDKYNEWIASKKADAKAATAGADKEWTKDDLVANGKAVYDKNCAVCHQANGQGLPPAFPALTGSKVATGPIADHVSIVLHGKNVMPKWGPMLNDVEIASVITYERNALGNAVGDMVQPAQIKAAR